MYAHRPASQQAVRQELPQHAPCNAPVSDAVQPAPRVSVAKHQLCQLRAVQRAVSIVVQHLGPKRGHNVLVRGLIHLHHLLAQWWCAAWCSSGNGSAAAARHTVHTRTAMGVSAVRLTSTQQRGVAHPRVLGRARTQAGKPHTITPRQALRQRCHERHGHAETCLTSRATTSASTIATPCWLARRRDTVLLPLAMPPVSPMGATTTPTTATADATRTAPTGVAHRTHSAAGGTGTRYVAASAQAPTGATTAAIRCVLRTWGLAATSPATKHTTAARSVTRAPTVAMRRVVP